MEKNEDKVMSKAKGFLALVLFTAIYFFFQKTIYPILALLFWLIFAMPLAGVIINSLEILNLPEIVINIIFTETDESTAMFAPTAREIHIFCTASHIFYTIGVFYSDKVNKILDRIKFKRKNK